MFLLLCHWLARQILDLPHAPQAAQTPHPISARNQARLVRKKHSIR